MPKANAALRSNRTGNVTHWESIFMIGLWVCDCVLWETQGSDIYGTNTDYNSGYKPYKPCIPMCVCSEDVFPQKLHIPSAKKHYKFRIRHKLEKSANKTWQALSSSHRENYPDVKERLIMRVITRRSVFKQLKTSQVMSAQGLTGRIS